jgi:sterol desaturase/sphingolipid hydroxylase (fatty acid hydroxylase superfamily)
MIVMSNEKTVPASIKRDGLTSVILYLLPVLLMFGVFYLTDARPWETNGTQALPFRMPHFLEVVFKNLNTWGLPAIMLVVGIVEFAIGLYETKWTKNERILDVVCFIVPKLAVRPLVAYFGLKLLPVILPNAKDAFTWVPFWWGFFIIAVADDLTQYWYHRLHHQVPWLWRFHRTHHSALYMGMAMASRQNIIYTIFFSQIYVTTALTYLGLGYPALFVTAIKSLITTGAHSSIKWDKPFYTIKWLKPIGWVMEHYKGNFGNMFFLWDIIFGTGIITRKYPQSYGIKHYKQEEWYAQFAWPLFKSKKEGSELSANGPEVGDIAEPAPFPEVKPSVQSA